MKIRKLKRGKIKKHKASSPSPRIRILLDKASSCIQQGRLGEAEDICREIINISPRTSEAYSILGIVCQEQGLLDEASAFLHKAVELDGANANGFFNLGTVLGQKGQYQQAVNALRRGLTLAPRNAKARNNLGLALAKMGNLAEAIVALERATELDPNYGEAWFNLGDAYYCRGHLQKAVDAYQCCIRLIPDFTEAYYNLSITQQDLKLLPAAIRSLQHTIELDPGHAAARHMLAALSGETPESAPQEFVLNLFDQYSNRFEADLVNRLEYRIPGRLRTLLDDCLPAGTLLSGAIDLGCGTGLSGQAFRDITDYLAGIDISKKMLEQAQDKGIYDDLFAGDLCDQLQQLPGLYDLFIAADVMVYIGKLEPLFQRVSSKSRQGSYFVFSIELQQEQDFILQSTGRYAHQSSYISRLAVASGFTIVSQEQTGIRKEGDAWIPGEIFVLRKKAA